MNYPRPDRRWTGPDIEAIARKRLQRHEAVKVEVAFDLAMQQERRKQKFGNVPTDGEQSKKQARRLSELRLMNEAGQIRGLARQPEWVLLPKQVRECGELVERKLSYVADFQYEEWTSAGWKLVVEDAKGFATPGYIQKRKLMLAIHGIEIRET